MTKTYDSVWDSNERAKDKYKTRNNTHKIFPEGTPVMVICHGQDHHFFYNETGRVTESRNSYLGITVKFDKPRRFDDKVVQNGFSFQPDDLVRIEDVTAYCRGCKYDVMTNNKYPGYEYVTHPVFGFKYCSLGVKKINKHKCCHRKLMKDKKI